VLYLDTYHTKIGSGMEVRKALQHFIEQLVGPDDLLAGMTPDMSPEALTFASRTEAMHSFLDSIWGRRDSIRPDPEEDYMMPCVASPLIQPETVKRLLENRRTKLTRDSLEDLVKHVGDLREERKAIVLITEGWTTFREDLRINNLTDPADRRPIHTGPVYVPPNAGKDPKDNSTPSEGMCEKIMMELANMETTQQFRDMPNVANRANASFYVVDPRGLPASDALLGSSSPKADLDTLKTKLDNMRELADRTDGMALAGSNDLGKEFARITQDLSSYYLL